jgi:hypothetical protein
VTNGVAYLIRGPFAAESSKELGEKLRSVPEEQVSIGRIMKTPYEMQVTAELADVAPGEYTLCTHRTMSVEKHKPQPADEAVPVVCVPRAIGASPAAQEFTQEIP